MFNGTRSAPLSNTSYMRRTIPLISNCVNHGGTIGVYRVACHTGRTPLSVVQPGVPHFIGKFAKEFPRFELSGCEPSHVLAASTFPSCHSTSFSNESESFHHRFALVISIFFHLLSLSRLYCQHHPFHSASFPGLLSHLQNNRPTCSNSTSSTTCEVGLLNCGLRFNIDFPGRCRIQDNGSRILFTLYFSSIDTTPCSMIYLPCNNFVKFLAHFFLSRIPSGVQANYPPVTNSSPRLRTNPVHDRARLALSAFLYRRV